MNFILLGPPGAGKGTVAAELARGHSMYHLSTGALFRAAVDAGSALGRRVDEVLQSGGLVPDDLTIAVVRQELDQRVSEDVVLDGFPRTVTQAQALESFAHIDVAIELDVPEQEVVSRLESRRICARCGAIFSMDSMPLSAERFCELVQRDDDTTGAICKRLSAYRRETAPVSSYYKKAGCLLTIDATGNRSEVMRRIERAISR